MPIDEKIFILINVAFVFLKEVFIWPAHFQLKPGESRTVNLRFEEPRKAQPALLPVFSGFISVSNNADNKVAQIPCI